MFPHSASSNIINSSTATGNYYESAVTFPHDQSFLIHSRPFPSDITPNLNPNPNPNSNSDSIISNSKQYQDLEEDPNHHIHPPLSVFYFPSPFEDVDVLLHQHHHLHDHEPLALQETISLAHNHHQTSFPLTAKMVDWDANKNDQVVINKEGEQQHQQQKQIPMLRKRSCKRDRHSKISTARGLRDRRMRLSLDVARKFFGLQDVLGFDKASKTVEWLLNQACAEIKKVTRERSGQNQNQSSSTTTATGPGARTTSSISECEVVSGTDEVATDDIIDKVSRNPSSSCTKDRIKKIIRKPKKSSSFNPRTKASRERARARARERTRERMGRQSKPCDDVDQATKTKDLSRLNSWSTFETGEESGGTQSHNNNNNNNNIHSSLEVLAEVEEPISSFQAAGTSSTTTDHHQDLIAIDGHDAAANMAIMGKWSPFSIFNYLQNTTGSISQEVYIYVLYIVFKSSSVHLFKKKILFCSV